MVLVHLVQVDVGLFYVEQTLPHFCQVDPAVAQLPFPRRLGLHDRAEEAAEQLVTEAHTTEFTFRIP